jgi:hypothetical protein
MDLVRGVARFVQLLFVSCAVILVATPARAQPGDAGAPEPDAGAEPSSATPPSSAAPLPGAAPSSSATPLPSATPPASATPPPGGNNAPEPANAPGAATPSSANTAPSTPPFGARGQLAVFGGSNISGSAFLFEGLDHGFQATFSPELDYFVARNFSLGLAVDLAYENLLIGQPTELREQIVTIAGGPRVGFNVPIGKVMSWYPRATLGFMWTHETAQVVSGRPGEVLVPRAPLVTGYLDVFAPLLFRPASHLLVGFGPHVWFGDKPGSDGLAVDGQQGLTVSMDFVFGGYAGGPEPEANAPAPPAALRFGEPGQWVVTNALSGSVAWSPSEPGNSTSLSGGISGSVDYFVLRRFSVGGAVSFSEGQVTAPDQQAVATVFRTNDRSATIGPRLGYALRIADAVSVYPIAELDVGGESEDVVTYGGYPEYGAARQTLNTVVVAVRLLAPVLVHPVPHFFVGFGPSYSHEFTHRVTLANDPSGSSGQFRGSTASLALLLGGWF